MSGKNKLGNSSCYILQVFGNGSVKWLAFELSVNFWPQCGFIQKRIEDYNGLNRLVTRDDVVEI